MIKFELDPSDATFLADQLARQLDRLQNELVHTDDRALHRDLARDIDRLTKVRERIVRAGGADAAPREMFLNG